MADIVTARLTAQNESHLNIMVKKFLDYERNPPTNPNFYDKPVTAMGWQTERWFQLCSEVVNGFWKNITWKSIRCVKMQFIQVRRLLPGHLQPIRQRCLIILVRMDLIIFLRLRLI
jgi:hypothetical protein